MMESLIDILEFVDKNVWNNGIFEVISKILCILIIVVTPILYKKGIIKLSLLKPETVGHDKEVFKKIESVCTLGSIIQILENIQSYIFYYQSDINKIRDFYYFLDNCESKFLIKKIEKEKQKLYNNLSNLDDFMATNYFVDENNRSKDYKRFLLDPEAKVSDDPKRREQFRNELNELKEKIPSCISSCKSLRFIVKKELHI
jgi:hypothetical protein